jgi:hypothetical protein
MVLLAIGPGFHPQHPRTHTHTHTTHTHTHTHTHDKYSKKQNTLGAGSVAQVVEHLPTKG